VNHITNGMLIIRSICHLKTIQITIETINSNGLIIKCLETRPYAKYNYHKVILALHQPIQKSHVPHHNTIKVSHQIQKGIQQLNKALKLQRINYLLCSPKNLLKYQQIPMINIKAHQASKPSTLIQIELNKWLMKKRLYATPNIRILKLYQLKKILKNETKPVYYWETNKKIQG